MSLGDPPATGEESPTSEEVAADFRAVERSRARVRRTLGWSVPAVLLVAWQLAATAGVIDTRLFPSPTGVVTAGYELLREGVLLEAVVISLRRVALGFTVGSAVGVLVGIALGLSEYLRAAFEPLLSAIYTVPKLALLPMLLLIFGIGELPIVALIAVSVFFYMWISTMSAVMSVDRGYLEAVDQFGPSGLQRLRHVIWPASLPAVFVGLRLSMGVSILVLVAAEFVQSSKGIGSIIWTSWRLFRARQMYVGMVVVALMGVASVLIVKWAANLAIPWSEQHGEDYSVM